MGDQQDTPDTTPLPGSSGSADSPTAPDFTPPPRQTDPIADDLERQARETIRIVRESAGELGQRVREVLKRATDYWDETAIAERDEDAVHAHAAQRARVLAQRWVSRDFLVDPELPDGMSVQELQESLVWRVELRERGESRVIGEGTEPYTGAIAESPGPVLPVWDYVFPTVPDIQSGERRERLAGTAMVAACATCHGTGHRPCATCEGKGFVTCPVCHGRSRLLCRRCHGRARIPDSVAQRRAGASKPYLQIRAERLMSETGSRLADFAERLRQDYGVPLPPSAHWAPGWAADEETIPCPDCKDGTVACACGDGKLVCRDCHGTGASDCVACGGTGRVVRYREVVRRFDTRISAATLSLDDEGVTSWLTDEMLERATGEHVWQGNVSALTAEPPAGIPAEVWTATRSISLDGSGAFGRPQTSPDSPDRKVFSQQVVLQKIPLTKVDYTFSGRPFSFVGVGADGSERFWAQDFPTRWARVSRFFAAISRDIGLAGTQRPTNHISEVRPVHHIDELRARRHQSLMRIPIITDEGDENAGKVQQTDESTPETPPDTE